MYMLLLGSNFRQQLRTYFSHNVHLLFQVIEELEKKLRESKVKQTEKVKKETSKATTIKEKKNVAFDENTVSFHYIQIPVLHHAFFVNKMGEYVDRQKICSIFRFFLSFMNKQI